MEQMDEWHSQRKRRGEKRTEQIKDAAHSICCVCRSARKKRLFGKCISASEWLCKNMHSGETHSKGLCDCGRSLYICIDYFIIIIIIDAMSSKNAGEDTSFSAQRVASL